MLRASRSPVYARTACLLLSSLNGHGAQTPRFDKFNKFDNITRRKALMRIAVLAVAAGLFLTACDSASTSPPAQTAVSFSQSVQPIFTTRCGNCHGGQPQGRPMSLAAGQALANTVNVRALQTDTSTLMDRIEPGNPDASYLVHKLQGSHTSPTVRGSGSRMPLSPTPLSDADIQLIRQWITEGAANN